MNSPGEYSVNEEDAVRSHQEYIGQKTHLASAYTSQTLTSRNPGLPTAAASHTDIVTLRTCTAHKLDGPHHISAVALYIACNRQKIVTFGGKGGSFFFLRFGRGFKIRIGVRDFSPSPRFWGRFTDKRETAVIRPAG